MPSPIRLAIVRKKYTQSGGGERFIERLLSGLGGDDSYDITVISNGWPESIIDAHKVITLGGSGLTRSGRLKRFNRAVSRIIQNGEFDLVQSHERLQDSDIYRLGDGVHASWINRQAACLSAHRKFYLSIDPFHRKVLQIEKKMAESERLTYVATSTLVKNELQEYYSVPDSRIAIIPNGVDTTFFQPPSQEDRFDARRNLGIPTDARVVSFIGSGFERKGLYELISAVSRVGDLCLVVAGRDKTEKQLQDLIQRLPKTVSVRFVGPISDVRPVLWSSDLFALPSIYDPSPNALLEALACGLPVICTDSVGYADEVLAAGCGLISTSEPENLQKSIEALFELIRSSNALSSAARTLALRHSWDLIIKSWLHLHKSLLESRL